MSEILAGAVVNGLIAAFFYGRYSQAIIELERRMGIVEQDVKQHGEKLAALVAKV